MSSVSKEQIAAAKKVDILDYLERYEPKNLKKVGNRHILRDHDSFVISNGKWCWNSQKIGCNTATALNYLIKARGYSFVDAVRELTSGEVFIEPNASKAKPPPERKPFSLPPRNRDNLRVIAYLQSRGIDRQLILAAIGRGLLYESSVFHNCVFVGRDERGKARFAALRGTMSGFIRDEDGSAKSYGFRLPPDFGRQGEMTNQCHSVAVFEAPIDALSHATLCPHAKCYRLSLGGTALVALTRFLERHPEVEKIDVCTDNDEAGNLAAARIAAEFPNHGITRSLPPCGKDFNESLLQIQKNERLQDRSASRETR